MARVEYHWQNAFIKAGFVFLHIGPKQVGKLYHKFLFPYKAYRYFKSLNINPDAFLVHESASGCFTNRGIPCFVESHGVERRFWESTDKSSMSLKTRLLYPIWRLYNCDKGLNNADKLLLINSEDKDYVNSKYGRNNKDIFLFKNGINNIQKIYSNTNKIPFTILFNGSWTERKGIRTLVKAAEILYKNNLNVTYLLIGTGKDEKTVILDWPEYLRSVVTVIPRFSQENENYFLQSSSLFVLPSFYEGQPLSLLQAMANGKCCLTTNCCGQKDIIIDGVNGLLFNPGDYLELSFLITKCYNNLINTDEIGKNAMQYTNNLSWDKVSHEVVQYLTENIVS